MARRRRRRKTTLLGRAGRRCRYGVNKRTGRCLKRKRRRR